MICAGWIRFRASLMAMRRTSWIDQRINDGVTMLWVLLWFGVSFFLAAADWRAGKSPETLRGHTLRIGEHLGDAAVDNPAAAASAITVSLDSTFVRSREEGERHLEIRVGTADGRCSERSPRPAPRSRR